MKSIFTIFTLILLPISGITAFADSSLTPNIAITPEPTPNAPSEEIPPPLPPLNSPQQPVTIAPPAAAKSNPNDPMFKQMDAYMDDLKTDRPAPSVSAQSTAPVVREAAQPHQPAVYDYDNVPLGQVLRLLAAQANVNYVEPMIPKEEVVSLHLSDMKPLDAFYRIAESRGFEIRIDENNTLTLRRSDLPSPSYLKQVAYPLRYLDPNWALSSVANLLGIPIKRPNESNQAYPAPASSLGAESTAPTAGSNGNVTLDSGSIVSGGDQSRPRFIPSLPMDTPLSTGGFADTAARGGAASMHSIYIDRARRALVVRATPDEQALVRSYIAKMDHPEPQVLIDTRILEILQDNTKDLGVDWTETFGDKGATFSLDISNNPKLTRPDQWWIAPHGAVLTYPRVVAALKWLATHKKVRNVSTPRVITRSGVPAAIRSVKENSIVLNSTTGSTLATQTAYIEKFYTGLTIDIVPFIRRDGQLDLNLNPSLSTSEGESNAPGKQKIPIINRRSMATSVVVPNGATLALGGLMETNSEDHVTEVPGLCRIPLIGPLLFKNHFGKNERTNLIIMVTPTIIPAAQSADLLLPKTEATALDESDAQLPQYNVQRQVRRARPNRLLIDRSKDAVR